jgi:hypothetical protein
MNPTGQDHRSDSKSSAEEWLVHLDEPLEELANAFELVTDEADRLSIPDRVRGRVAAHALASAIRQARHEAVGTQVAAAAAWGRAQSQVSRLEADPSVVQLGTLIDYLSSLNVELSIELKVDGRTIAAA